MGRSIIALFRNTLLGGATELERAQDGQPWIILLFGASTGCLVEVGPATCAEAFAIFATQRPLGQGEQNLFANQRRQIDVVTLVKRKFQIFAARVSVILIRYGFGR